MRSVRTRLERLEHLAEQLQAYPWFDLATWKAETQAGVTLEEQEARRLAEHPHQAGEIRAAFALWRARWAEVAALTDPDDMAGAPGQESDPCADPLGSAASAP